MEQQMINSHSLHLQSSDGHSSKRFVSQLFDLGGLFVGTSEEQTHSSFRVSLYPNVEKGWSGQRRRKTNSNVPFSGSCCGRRFSFVWQIPLGSQSLRAVGESSCSPFESMTEQVREQFQTLTWEMNRCESWTYQWMQLPNSILFTNENNSNYLPKMRSCGTFGNFDGQNWS